MGEITKIDRRTGELIWRLGGRNNQFAIVDDPLGGFSSQHSVRVLDNGNLLLYDNGLRHTPPESRAVEYRLDVSTRTATMVWQYRRVPAVFTPFLGSVQRFQNGNTRSEEHTSELQSPCNLVCRLLLEKKKKETQQRDIEERIGGRLRDGGDVLYGAAGVW